MISVAVMAHRKREAFVVELVDQLGRVDQVVWDRHNDRHETGLRSILAYDPEASHHLIVQDDALPARDLVRACERMAPTVGEHPVGLYVGRTGPINLILDQMMRANRVGFVPSEGPHWGVAILLPTAHIPELAEWYEAADVKNYDRRISRWYGRRGIDCWYTAPSLVEHRHEDNPSLVRGRNGGRRAAWFIGDRSALDFEFDTLLRGATVATFRNYNTGQVVELDAHDSRFNRINRMAREGNRWERLDKPEEVREASIPTDDAPADERATVTATAIEQDPSLAEPSESFEHQGHKILDSNIDTVMEWVTDPEGDARERAEVALEHELEKDKPRVTLVEALGELVSGPAEVGVDGPPANSGVDAA